MICRSCLREAYSLGSYNKASRSFSTRLARWSPATPTTTTPRPEGNPAALATPGVAQSFSTPLTPPKDASLAIALGEAAKQKPKAAPLPVSICPAGTPLKGLNYIKGKQDPIALAEAEYPEWLWHCLDIKVKEDKETSVGDEFSKSKKVRRKAAKAQRKLEAKLLASGDLSALQPKIPITKQSVDLPANEEGTVAGALRAGEKREELRGAMRRERRSKIKEANFLKAM